MVVYPVEGRRVRCPVTARPVPADGLTVPDGDLYWARALTDGDVTRDAPKADGPCEPESAAHADDEASHPADEPAPAEEHA